MPTEAAIIRHHELAMTITAHIFWVGILNPIEIKLRVSS